MAFRPGMPVFDRSGERIGSLERFTVTGPRSYRINEVEDFAFFIPRNDGDTSIITQPQTATYRGVASAQVTSGTSITVAQPSGTQIGDKLLAVIAIGNGVGMPTPAGWKRIGPATISGNARVIVYERDATSAGSVNHVFPITSAAPIAGAVLAYGRALRFAPWAPNTSVGTSIHTPSLLVPHVPEYYLSIVAGDRNTTWTPPGTLPPTLVERGVTGLSLRVGQRTVEERNANGRSGSTTWTAGSSGANVGIALLVQETPSVEQLLARDNLVYIANSLNMRGWAGAIGDVDYDDVGVHVRVHGTASLFSGLETARIEQDEGEAWAIARRLVKAANAKQGGAGDLVVGFNKLAGAQRPARGLWVYEGDILEGLQGLARETLSEFYMTSGITGGRLWTTLNWGGELSIDRKSTIIRDGTGGQVAPGTRISYSGADVVTYGRLRGATTQMASFADYPSAGQVVREITPEASLHVPPTVAGAARRREQVNFTVNWGLPKERQRALMRAIQDRYVALYKRFLYAFHDRFGMPFLPGYEWGGPEGENIKWFRMSVMRTVNVLGRIGATAIGFAQHPSLPSASLEDVREKQVYEIADAVGVAYDYSNRRVRWIARSSTGTVERAIRGEFTGESMRVAREGETLNGIATDENEPTHLWALTGNGTTSTIRRYDMAANALLSEFTLNSNINDIAVDLTRGLLYTVGPTVLVGATYHLAYVTRDLNTGTILSTKTVGPVTTYGNVLVGVQLTGRGDFIYLLSDTGHLLIHYTETGGFAGSRAMPMANMTGLFIDQPNLEIWFMKASRIRVYYATIAVAAPTGGTGQTAGAPGFDSVARGQFVHVVMARNRGSISDQQPIPAPEAPPPGGGGSVYYTRPRHTSRSILGRNSAYGYPATAKRRDPLKKPPILTVIHIGGAAYASQTPGINVGQGTYNHVTEAIAAGWTGATYHTYVARNGEFINILPRDEYAAHGNPTFKSPNTTLPGIQMIRDTLVNGIKNATKNADGSWSFKRKPDEFIYREIICTGNFSDKPMTLAQMETVAFLIAKDELDTGIAANRGSTVLTHADLDSVTGAPCAFPPAEREAKLGTILARRLEIGHALWREKLGLPPNEPTPPLTEQRGKVYYRPLFRSQFDYTAQYGFSPADPAYHQQYWKVNCGPAVAAMALDRHTVGRLQPRPADIRALIPTKFSTQLLSATTISASGTTLDELRGAWSRYSTGHTLDVHKREPFSELVRNLKLGRGAIVQGRFRAIPARYNCQCTLGSGGAYYNCYGGTHALYINEIRENGDMLCYDPICRPRDPKPKRAEQLSALDPSFGYITTEAQPKWIPQQYIRRYGELFLGTTSDGSLRYPGRINVAYTQVAGVTTGPSSPGLPAGDVYAVHSKGWWEHEVRAAASPAEPATLERIWRTDDQRSAFYYGRQIAVADPQVVIAGEEGRVDEWQPTAMGYGVKGISYYRTKSGVAIRSDRWYLHPWDIPAERFWLDPPEWPEGEAYLREAIERHNRAQGVQAIEVVNRGNLWERVELGALLTLRLNLQGPHPDGVEMTVRVVAYVPDENSGYMQLLTEVVG